MTIKAANFARSTLQTAVQPADTVLVVASTDASKFPTLGSGDWFYLTLDNGVAQEIVKCISTNGSSLTVVRGQENTTPRAWPAGTSVYCAVTAGTLNDVLSNATGVNEVPETPSGVAYARAFNAWVNADTRYARTAQSNTFTNSPQIIDASSAQLELRDAGQSRSARFKITGDATETHPLLDATPAQNSQTVRFRLGRETSAGRFVVEIFKGDNTNTLVHRFDYDEVGLVVGGGKVGIGTNAPRTTLDIQATDALILPAGSISQRPTSAPGALRFNTETGGVEVFTGSDWTLLATSAQGAPPNTLLWATTPSDLPGSGFTWPGFYRLLSDGSAEFMGRLTFGAVYKTLPQGNNSGTPQPFAFVASNGSSTSQSTLSIPDLTIPAGTTILIVYTDRDANPPKVGTVTHPALSNRQDRFTDLSYDITYPRQGRTTLCEFVSSGGTGNLVLTFVDDSNNPRNFWVCKTTVRTAPVGAVGSYLGTSAGTAVTSGNQVSANRVDSSAAVDVCFASAFVSTASPTWSVSRSASSLETQNYSTWGQMVSTSEAGNVSNQTQTFSISPGSFAGARAYVAQWGTPTGSPAQYTISESDFGYKLICQSGATQVTLPAIGMPSGLDNQGRPTGVEGVVVIEVPPSSTLTLVRGSGATFWSSATSGNVASATVTCNATTRKQIVLVCREVGFWQVVSGAVD